MEPQGLQKAGMTLESPVTIHVETIRLRSILSLMLLGTGLDYELRQGLVVVIASRDKELITRRYPIGDLAYEKSAEGRRFAPEPLIALLRENDGYGAIIGGGILYKQSGPIELDEEAQTLVITQTIDAHALIAARLADLRQIKRQYAAKGDIDFPTLERIVAKHAGYVPFHQLLENKIVWVEVDKADGVRFTIDERTFDSLYEVLQFLQQQSDNVLRPGILLSRDGSRGTVDEATLAAMEYFCRNYDVDLFAFKSAWPRRGAFEAQPFRAFKSTRSPYADEP
ncbi:MAG: hypothetical protein EXS05_03715 [Planctomycetaceae bacterium]|nr:hypothetical protein [Planctomycetaceae bacterium]